MSSSLIILLITTILIGMIPRAMPIFAAAIGETVDQSAGVLNLGVEGMMLMGAVIGLLVDYYTHNILLAFLAAGFIGLAFSVIHGIVTITMRLDQTTSGTALWFIGWGISGVIYASIFGISSTPPTILTLRGVYIPYLSSIPFFGKFIFGEDPMAYILIVLLIVVQYFLFHTKQGLNLRTVGNDPRVAEIMGVNPIRYRYAALLFGGFMAGIGGAYLTLVVVGSFYFDMTAGIGFIAVALVYFGKWNPWRVFAGTLIFGAVYVFYLMMESIYPAIPYDFYQMLPYLATLVMILVIGAKARAPTALTLPYIKEG
ncbi:MAG: ABC transporter permease [Nitrososphaeria archaeon]